MLLNPRRRVQWHQEPLGSLALKDPYASLLSIITPRSSNILPRPHQHPQTVPQLRRHRVRQWQEFLPCSFRRLWGCRVPDSVDDRAQPEVNDIWGCLRLEGVAVFTSVREVQRALVAWDAFAAGSECSYEIVTRTKLDT
jgi:hypothetical protein